MEHNEQYSASPSSGHSSSARLRHAPMMETSCGTPTLSRDLHLQSQGTPAPPPLTGTNHFPFLGSDVVVRIC